MGVQDISYFSLIFVFILLFIPLGASFFLKMGIIKDSLGSFFRMCIQLVLVGIFLKFIFIQNNIFLTLLWVLIMMLVATFSVIKNSDLEIKKFIVPIFMAFLLSNITILVYFNFFIVNLKNIFEAKYVIVIMGMLLGNSLKANIIGINGFYKTIKREENRYLYLLAAGAGKYEAKVPFIRKNLHLAVNPTIATMATTGIVSLPGMMTGQILGGSDPMVAIKYQIAIMVAIFTSSTIGILCGIFFTLSSSFDEYDIFIRESIQQK